MIPSWVAADAPEGYSWADGLGWLAPTGQIVGAGRWWRAPSWRLYFEPARPEPPEALAHLTERAASLDKLDALVVGLRVRFPGKSWKDIGVVASAALGRWITHDDVRQRVSRLRKSGILTPESMARAKELIRRREGATPPSKIRIAIFSADSPAISEASDTLQGVEDAEALAEAKKREGTRAAGRTLGKFLKAQTELQDLGFAERRENLAAENHLRDMEGLSQSSQRRGEPIPAPAVSPGANRRGEDNHGQREGVGRPRQEGSEVHHRGRSRRADVQGQRAGCAGGVR